MQKEINTIEDLNNLIENYYDENKLFVLNVVQSFFNVIIIQFGEESKTEFKKRVNNFYKQIIDIPPGWEKPIFLCEINDVFNVKSLFN
jgi:hypothetical protein